MERDKNPIKEKGQIGLRKAAEEEEQLIENERRRGRDLEAEREAAPEPPPSKDLEQP